MADLYQCLRYSSVALEASHVIRDRKCVLVSLYALNTNAATRYIQLFDSATLPADNAVPAFVFPVATNGVLQLTVPGIAIPFQFGLAICNSSTPNTKTIGGADSLFQVLFS